MEHMRDAHVSQSVIKFIDIVLDLYSPVACDLRNEMRNLQTTLLYGKSLELSALIAGLQDKLTIKVKNNQHFSSLSNDTAEIKTHRALNDPNKENISYLHNVNRISSCTAGKKHDTSLSIPSQQKNRKTSVSEASDKSFECQQDNRKNRFKLIERNSSKTLLKIIKKSKFSQQKREQASKSFAKDASEVARTLLLRAEQILFVMDSLQPNESQQWKYCD